MEQTNGTNNQSVVTPVLKPEDLITPIKFAESVGKPPQYIYQLLRDKKVPTEVYVQIADGTGKTFPRFIKEEAAKWWNNRPGRGQKQTASLISNPDEVIARMIDMFAQVASEQPNNKALTQLAEGMAKLQANLTTAATNKSADNVQ